MSSEVVVNCLLSQVKHLEVELTHLHEENAALRADKERMDWLDEVMNYKGGGYGMKWCFFTPIDAEDVRTAIDAARKETK